MPLSIPGQQEVARKTSTPLFPKNWASHLLRGECQVVRIGKRSPEWRWLKDKEEKSLRKQNKGKSEDHSEDLRQNKQHSWLAQFTQGKPGRRKKHIKRGAKALSLSPACAGVLFSSCLWVDMPSRLEDGVSCYYLNKIELQHGAITLICLRAITWSI